VVFATVWGAFFDGRVGGFYSTSEGIEFEALDCVWDDWGNACFGSGNLGEVEGGGLGMPLGSGSHDSLFNCLNL
jgi:hypothetical protein